jgi:hypothetical protein
VQYEYQILYKYSNLSITYIMKIYNFQEHIIIIYLNITLFVIVNKFIRYNHSYVIYILIKEYFKYTIVGLFHLK